MYRKLLLPVLFFASVTTAQAQGGASASPEYELHISSTKSPVKIDGILDEPAWLAAAPVTGFRYNYPVDTGFSGFQTEIRMSFDDKHLYISAVCRQPRESITIQSLKRDFAAGTSDALNILLDPFKDGLNGFTFGINPFNVQREATIDNGATLSYEWDNRWSSAVHNATDSWTVEIAIPFKTLRYRVADGENRWKLNFVRFKLQNPEISTWYPVPRQYAANNLAFTGTLVWDEPPPRPGANISIIPYATGRVGVDYLRDTPDLKVSAKPSYTDAGIGGDAKIAVSPSLNLDLTINPDFSQVEVDRQVTNLSRFELFFPERRQFFLENRDLFAMFGFPDTRPFFSRRIGLARNPVTGLNETVPILAGARLSGKLNNNWRMGLLNMQTKQVVWDSSHTLPGANFTVATLQRKVFERSAVSAIYVDKENFLGKLEAPQKEGYQPWHRVAGVEYNLYSKDNKWEGEWYYHRSFSPEPEKRGATLAHFLAYTDRRFNVRLGYLRIDSTYSADAGFVPRTGVQNFYPGFELSFYPDSKRLNTINVGVDGSHTLSLKGKETDREVGIYTSAEFQNQSSLSVSIENYYTFLFEDFDPTNLYRDGTILLPGNTGYTYNLFNLDYASSPSNKLQFGLSSAAGQYFNGTAFTVTAQLAYRIQPFGLITMSADYTHIQLPAPYASADIWLLGPRAELAFSKKVFASAFFQYNTQANNFNINARLQWRFAPVSDLFLVYTDNSFAEHLPNTSVRFLAPKNKTFVLKAVYWLNL